MVLEDDAQPLVNWSDVWRSVAATIQRWREEGRGWDILWVGRGGSLSSEIPFEDAFCVPHCIEKVNRAWSCVRDLARPSVEVLREDFA